MNPKEARQAWVELLRSGEFKQGKHALRTQDGRRCCLGVACDAYLRHGGFGQWMVSVDYPESPATFVIFDNDDRELQLAVLPRVVRDWLGLNGQAGTYICRDEYGEPKPRSLTGDNDNRDLTFDEIADIIESEPAGFLAEVVVDA